MACVELDLPLATRFMSTARAVAASLGAEAGWSIDEIDDFRLAINEAASLLADVDDPESGRLHVGFDIDDGEMTATVTRHHLAGGTGTPVEIDELARRILSAVVDRFETTADSMLLVKKSAASSTR